MATLPEGSKKSKIKGKAALIWLSFSASENIRFERIGKVL
jgi:hypothetical protein